MVIYIKESEKENLNPEQRKFLEKARRFAYLEEIYPDPNRRRSLDKYRKLLVESTAKGIHQVNPLLLGDTYEEGREKARRVMEEESA
ncbi:MAG TPA: hypothetical protein VF189_04870 [Patescibacteria group bacterium]